MNDFSGSFGGSSSTTPAPKVPKGVKDQQYAELGMMVLRILGMTFTEGERDALAKVIGAVVREAPKVEHSNLVKTIRLIEKLAGGGA
jgi:hypothetical protein